MIKESTKTRKKPLNYKLITLTTSKAGTNMFSIDGLWDFCVIPVLPDNIQEIVRFEVSTMRVWFADAVPEAYRGLDHIIVKDADDFTITETIRPDDPADWMPLDWSGTYITVDLTPAIKRLGIKKPWIDFMFILSDYYPYSSGGTVETRRIDMMKIEILYTTEDQI
ncbi:MAG: Mab-21 family protein [Proteobacteria bacterium]|jgi:hypothetical protein|nr:Mab-21 family protein [Pseudomonadota bacterium]